MKTNLEELNYRFIKELLNDKVYKTHLEQHYYYDALIKGEKSDFKYNIWCKGLFRGNKKDILLQHLEMCTNSMIDVGDEYWNELYTRSDEILLDIINIKPFKDNVVNLWMQQDAQDFEYILNDLAPQNYVPEDFSVIKNKHLSTLEVLHVVKEWYLKGLEPENFQTDNGIDLDEHIDEHIEKENINIGDILKQIPKS